MPSEQERTLLRDLLDRRLEYYRQHPAEASALVTSTQASSNSHKASRNSDKASRNSHKASSNSDKASRNSDKASRGRKPPEASDAIATLAAWINVTNAILNLDEFIMRE
jgi:hypothetical protein